MKRKGTRWRVDWFADGSPEIGQLVRHVTPSGTCSYARVLAVRPVRNIKPLPDGCTCRFMVSVQRMDGKPSGEAVTWTCNAYPRAPRKDYASELDAALWIAP